jgi:hypothetical protein
MKIFLKLVGTLLVIIGLGVTVLGILAALQGKDAVGGVLGGGIFIALGMTIILINRKGYSW